MKFGSVATKIAAGAVLAHSTSLGQAGRLRKGRILDDADVRALVDAGHQEVIVARLEEGDIIENDAAHQLAAALVPNPDAASLTVTDPFTGRVNLLASGPGVAVLDEAAIAAVNRIDPMITVATVPQYQQMHHSGMVATIKIISYAVAGGLIAQACRVAQNAISLRPPKINTAELIITEIPGGAGDKGRGAIAERLAAFGMTLPTPHRIPHDTEALARALKNTAAELVLILTGSATSDIDDVAPMALRRAGGVVERFGMPVDPGNLLFTGALEGRRVVGLPGCARSPALNGADWVLSRIICGIDVSPDDIAGMGVGGLLKEIPTRPQPRRGQSKPQ